MQGDLIDRKQLCTELEILCGELYNEEVIRGIKIAIDVIKERPTAYSVEKVVEETDKVLADLNVVEVLSHFEPDKTIQMPLSNFLCAFKDEIGRLIRNGGKE